MNVLVFFAVIDGEQRQYVPVFYERTFADTEKAEVAASVMAMNDLRLHELAHANDGACVVLYANREARVCFEFDSLHVLVWRNEEIAEELQAEPTF